MAQIESLRFKKTTILKEISEDLENWQNREEAESQNQSKIERLEEGVDEGLEDFRKNLEHFLFRLESCENEVEIAQKVDLQVQDWKFLLEVQHDSF